MIRRRYQCHKCGKLFEVDVLEPGEAEERRLRPVPVRCPECGSTQLEPVSR